MARYVLETVYTELKQGHTHVTLAHLKKLVKEAEEARLPSWSLVAVKALDMNAGEDRCHIGYMEISRNDRDLPKAPVVSRTTTKDTKRNITVQPEKKQAKKRAAKKAVAKPEEVTADA